MAVVRKIRCQVAEVRDHGAQVYSIDLTPGSAVPKFKPGQFLHLALDPYEPGGFWPESRVFSIASSPDDRDRVTITYAVKGSYTTRMERELRIGLPVWIKLPYGEFVIEPDTDVVLFAGGTGITAFTAFLSHVVYQRTERVLLYYGARRPDLFVYERLVEMCVRESSSFSCRFVCDESDGCLSVEKAWPEICRLRDPVFYLSGPPQMLVALNRDLCQHGVQPNAIRTDAWS